MKMDFISSDERVGFQCRSRLSVIIESSLYIIAVLYVSMALFNSFLG